MGVKLELGDVQSSSPPVADQPPQQPVDGEPAAEPADSGEDLLDVGLKTLRRVNEGIQEFKELQQNMNELGGQAQQQGTQQPIQDQPSQNKPSVGEQPDVEGEPAQQQSQQPQNNTDNIAGSGLLEQIPPQLIHDYVMKGVNHLQSELGRDATLEDAEVWLVENREELLELARQGKQVLLAQYGNWP